METLNRALETIPGLSIIFSIAALLMLEESSEVASAIRVFVVAWLLFKISSYLDTFFNLFYGPRPEDRAPTFLSRHMGRTHRAVAGVWYRIRRVMPGFKTLEGNRDEAVRVVFPRGVAPGIYKRAHEQLLKEHRKLWDEEVAPLLNISKAARAFIAPFFLTAIITAFWNQRIRIPAGMMNQARKLGGAHLFTAFRSDFIRAAERLDFLNPVWCLILFTLCVFVYLWLRIAHMNRLYKLAAGSEVRTSAP